MVSVEIANYCGAPDQLGNLGSSWGLETLKWSIVDAIPDIKDRQYELTTEVFDSISKVCGLKFTYTKSSDRANIIFLAKRGRRNQLDGPGGTLAYAYLPPRARFRGTGLACVFDLDEGWETNIKFKNVCCHEIGHNLGLSHSSPNDGQADLMDPTYNPSIGTMQKGDIERLRRLYGPPTIRPELPPAKDTPDVDGGIELVLRVGGVEWFSFDLLDLAKR